MTYPVTLSELSEAIHAGEVTSREVTEELLARADRVDPSVGTYLLRFDQESLQAADRLDAELKAGHDRGPLHGVPLGIKDIIATEEGPTTAQSLVLDPDWGSHGDAPVVARLRAAGAVITGKTTTMEFACGVPDPTKPFPVPRNPWDLSTWPGGSSSGTGSGVVAGLFYGGLGTDTGGSIRCPAAFCGISGHKPTFGLVPKSGCVPLGYSYDHIGPLARSALDCALMLAVMAGYDGSDPTSSNEPVPDVVGALDGDLRGVRVGVDRTVAARHPGDPALDGAFEAAVEVLGSAGASVVEVEIPYYEELTVATMSGWTGEALAIHRSDLQTRWSDYGRGTRLAIAGGALVSSQDYVQAQRVRRAGAVAIARLLHDTCDVIVTPTAAVGAPKVDGLAFAEVIDSVYTPVWNAVGFPALSVPMGTTAGGLPLGLQIAGLPYADGLVLRIGDAYQRRTDHHLAVPELAGALPMIQVPLTVSEAAARLRAGRLAVELTKAVLDRADCLDDRLGTYLARFDDEALVAAQAADADFARGVDKGPLQGIPIGIKDILASREGPTTAQSLVLDPAWGEGKDGPVVARLREAGAVITGKTTTMEFAVGLPDPAKPFPLPRNPWKVDHWTGGSSSGTGNGIAAGMFLAGIGTDTGGSIRIPASFCGISGLKPTFGRVPKSGCVPLGTSLDHIGPMARSARDCASMLAVIAGYDPSDESCADRPVDDYERALGGSLAGLRVGVLRAQASQAAPGPGILAAFEDAVAVLAGRGAELAEVTLPYFEEMRVASVITSRAEALAYHRDDLGERWDDYFAATRVTLGRAALASGADYVQAQRVRRLALGRLAELFDSVDVVVGIASSTAAFHYDSLRGRTVDDLVRSNVTSYWNATGRPALVVPMGFDEEGLPLSLQIAGRPFDEATVLAVGDAYQQETDWHLQVPPLVTAVSASA